MDPLHRTLSKHVALTRSLHLSTWRKAIILLAITAVALYAMLFSTTPALHDPLHGVRHGLMIIPCH